MIIQDILHPLHSFLYIWTGCASLSGAKKTKQGACFLRSSPRFFGVPKQRPRHVVRFGLSSYLGCGFLLRVEKPSRCVWWKWSLKSKCTYTEFTSGWDPKNKKKVGPQSSIWCLFLGSFVTSLLYQNLSWAPKTRKNKENISPALKYQKLRSHQLQQSHRALVGIEYQMV